MQKFRVRTYLLTRTVYACTYLQMYTYVHMVQQSLPGGIVQSTSYHCQINREEEITGRHNTADLLDDPSYLDQAGFHYNPGVAT